MRHHFTLEKAPIFIKFFITLALFVAVKDLGSIDSFAKLAVALLEFIIILELVRMVIEFLFSDDNRIKLRLMIDSTIVFFIRDIMLIVNDKFDVTKIVSILGIIGVLFIFRIMAMKYSPSYMEEEYRNKLDEKGSQQ
ncbi:MAG: phosphate-starvation-inducible PsiE family protein [Sulfurimonadaceae bacterium]|nr:phosphate-starvation-inducible PsiE family protein [Sulfurimonadaceae bacterium]